MTTPSSPVGQEMSERDARAFLASKDNGVLSLGVENDGYGFPIAYSFDPADDHVVLGFVARPDSKKRAFADGTETATFTVYDFDDVDAWRSVIVEGTVSRTDDDGSNRVPDIFYERENDAEVVNLDSFERTWYELAIESIPGRQSGPGD